MPLFEVTLSDGTTQVLQAHSKKMLKEALQNVTLTRQVWRCKACRKEIATVRNTLCEACWTEAKNIIRNTTTDLPITEQEIKDLAMSFFVVG